MHIKRYQAPDMRRALKKVTEDLGSEAVILSNRKTSNGVELWASGGEKSPVGDVGAPTPSGPANAVSPEGEILKSEPIKAKRPQRTYDRHLDGNLDRNLDRHSNRSLSVERLRANGRELLKREMSKLPADQQAALVNSSAHQERADVHVSQSERLSIRAMQEELASVKDDLRRQTLLIDQLTAALSSAKHSSTNRSVTSPLQASNRTDIPGDLKQADAMVSREQTLLLQMGFDYAMVSRWCGELAQLDRLQWEDIEALLCRQLDIAQGEIWHSKEKRRFIFLGPTGVGKTTTIGKIASRYLLETHNPNSLALVTTDTLRNGAADHLKRFAKQFGCAFHRVAEGKPLERTLQKLKSKHLVLVDTGGVTPNDSNWERQCQQLFSCRTILEPILVLPATLQRRVLAGIVDDYQPFNCHYSIVSKLDESLSLGEVLSTLIDRSLTVAYVTDGLSVADDLHRPKAQELVRFAKHLGEHMDGEGADRYAGPLVANSSSSFEMLN